MRVLEGYMYILQIHDIYALTYVIYYYYTVYYDELLTKKVTVNLLLYNLSNSKY
jgi:hypothetical protein